MKNIFVLGYDDFNLEQMKALPKAGDYRFHGLYAFSQLQAGTALPVDEVQRGALERLNAFSGSVDAIVGYWDCPVSTMLPLLRAPFGLPSPSLASVLKCEHKYWSRLEQKKVIPEYCPEFCAVDPFAERPLEQVTLDYPFWIKPIKSVSSHLGFKVRDRAEFDHAIELIRQGIYRYGDTFNHFLGQTELPDAVAGVDGRWCIAESIISRGAQCTLEGYVYRGEVVVYGALDSFRSGEHRSSFSYYQYPSTVPDTVQDSMTIITRRFMQAIGFDNGPFNIEFYWDRERDTLRMLEVNTRISKSHCPLFQRVDGVSHHQVMLDLALGNRPDIKSRRGRYRYATKHMWRVTRDARVRRAPTAAELAALSARLPGVAVETDLVPGMRLSELHDQDSYSYELAAIYIGSNSQRDIDATIETVKQALNIELEPVDEDP